VQKITPEQLKIIINHLIEIYVNDFSGDKIENPHFEHIEVDGRIFKVGYTPNGNSTPTIIDIRIIDKGVI
jgi:hypothetical protein